MKINDEEVRPVSGLLGPIIVAGGPRVDPERDKILLNIDRIFLSPDALA